MAELAIGGLLSTLASAASTIAPFAALAGTAVTAAGTLAAGKSAAELSAQQGLAQKQAAEFEAKQLEAQAKDERASAQRDAFMYQRQKKAALSRLQTVSAGSGFTATDPSSLAIADEIEKYGTLQQQMAAYGGESRAAGLRDSAAARRWSGETGYRLSLAEGKAKQTASYLSAGGSLLEGASSLFSKYAPKRSAASSTVGRYG